MNDTFCLLLMIFFHIVDDCYLQGWLASAKQKTWWQENAPQSLYRYDYIWALIMHSFSWSFMIMLPIAMMNHFSVGWGFVILLFLNVISHAIVDNLKANDRSINLWQDQLIHLAQIVLTFVFLVY